MSISRSSLALATTNCTVACNVSLHKPSIHFNVTPVETGEKSMQSNPVTVNLSSMCVCCAGGGCRGRGYFRGDTN